LFDEDAEEEAERIKAAANRDRDDLSAGET